MNSQVINTPPSDQGPGLERANVPLSQAQTVHGLPPSGDWSHPTDEPRLNELGEDDVYVPAGWCWVGGDPDELGAVPRHRVWVDGFIMKRFPVTNTLYLDFLNDLLAINEEAKALQHVPRERSGSLDDLGAMLYQRGPDGRFRLGEDADGSQWMPDWPVFMIRHCSARAYCAWLARRTGQPWRLPAELEWEKAARGVDGREFPWGSRFDPSWCCMRDSSADRPLPVPVDSFVVDSSPYGVRGMAGNVQEWCAEPHTRHGPPLRGDVVTAYPSLPQTLLDDPQQAWVVRGGFWHGIERFSRSAFRGYLSGTYRGAHVSFRVARSVHGWAPMPPLP